MNDDEMALAHRSQIWRIYHASHGTIYELTGALHRLLDSAYIADDVPVSMIELPAPAICIIPNPEWHGYRQGIRAIALFRRRIDAEESPCECLALATWEEFKDGSTRVKNFEYP